MEKYSVASTLIKQDVNKMNVMVDIRHINAKSKAEAIGIYMVEISEQFPEHHVHAHPVALPSYNSDYTKCLESLRQIESLCDNTNPTHEDIWRIAHQHFA